MRRLDTVFALVVVYFIGVGLVTAAESDLQQHPQGAAAADRSNLQSEANAPLEEDIVPFRLNEHTTLSGAIEVEAVFGEDFEGNNFSELALATAEIGLQIQPSEVVTGYMLVSYDDAEGDLFLDEATIALNKPGQWPMTITAGKFYMPFGNFDTDMIQDPLTLEIGEIGSEGVAVEFEQSGFYGMLFGYDGINEAGSSDQIESYGAQIGYGYEKEALFIIGGAGWVNNLADCGAIAGFLEENGMEEIKAEVAGLNLYLAVEYGSWSVIAEYVQALDGFDLSEIAYTNRGAKPGAWNTELAYATQLFDTETVFATGYQQSREAVDLGLPESRIIGAVRAELFEGTTLAFEYFYDNDYGEEKGGTGNSANTFTLQLTYEF